ncbi:unnamed protein product [marine sediment metagenome]|uniref:Uncharacterized protein n=1 Tax=marine sediment metagenome TaxID=412755 RepID=X1TVG7_9ZZZZ
MSEPEDIKRVVCALAKVPPKDLLIIELANRFTKDGQLDYDALAEAQPEVNVAIAEAKMYGAYTIRAVSTLEQLEAIPADVGSGHPTVPE